MATVTVPTLSEKRLAALARHNLAIIQTIGVAEFEKVLVDYIARHNVLHLATGGPGGPRSTTLEYFHDGLTLYIASEGGGKIANIKADPRVSFTIADPYAPQEDFFGAAGLQGWGTATVFRRHDEPQRFSDIYRHMRYGDALARQGLAGQADAVNFYLITIMPRKLIYLNYRQGFRKVTWEQDA
jgi:hypothetical protein